MTAATKSVYSRFFGLFAADTRNVSRDPALLFSILFAILMPIGVAFFRPTIDNAALDAFGLPDFTGYLSLVVFTLPAFLIGWVTGFLLLEDRDDGPLLALDITPTGKAGFFAYRATITAIITALITGFGVIILAPNLSLPIVVMLALLAAIEAVCVAFILPAIARNKVEGLAVTKIVNIGALVPLLALVPSPFRYLGSFVPTFWIGELLRTDTAHYLSFLLKLGFAIAIHGVVVTLLYRLAIRRIG